MHRFYSPELNNKDSLFWLKDFREIHHLKDVLRLKEGNELKVFNGKGLEITGVIRSLNRSSVEIEVRSHRSEEKKKSRCLLACAIPKRSKFETIIEKTTELGVDEIIPLQTERTEIVIPKGRTQSKKNRYQTIAVNAAKQSGRLTIPIIHPVTPFKETLDLVSATTVSFIPCLTPTNRLLADCLMEKKRCPSAFIFFIGPEGDFTPGEIAFAQEKGCIPVSLGPAVLKVETAAIAVVAISNFILFT